MSAEIASIVLASEAALALYPILIKTVLWRTRKPL